MSNETNTSLDAALIDRAHQAILVFDSEGTIIRSNEKAEQTVSAISKGGIVLSEEDMLQLFGMEKLDAEQTQDRHEIVIGERNIHVVRFRVPLSERTMIAYVLQDITGEKRQIASLHRQTSDVLWSLRSRITSVQNALTLLEDCRGGGENEEMHELLIESRLEIWRISNYVDKLHDLSLLNANELEKQLDIEEVDLKELIAEATSNIAACAAEWSGNFEFSDNIPGKTLIRCDRHRSSRIIESIVTNALAYADSKATVAFSLGTPGDAAVTLCVADNGKGIPDAEQARVFSYGFRGSNVANSRFTGMGMSLYLARQIMIRMRGGISFESKEGVGSIFSLVFAR